MIKLYVANIYKLHHCSSLFFKIIFTVPPPGFEPRSSFSMQFQYVTVQPATEPSPNVNEVHMEIEPVGDSALDR